MLRFATVHTIYCYFKRALTVSVAVSHFLCWHPTTQDSNVKVSFRFQTLPVSRFCPLLQTASDDLALGQLTKNMHVCKIFN